MYGEMLEFVEKKLIEGEGNASRNIFQTFRSRFEHIKRVFTWVNRLLPDFPNVNVDVVKTATVFHDSGYAGEGYKMNHPQKGVMIFREYAQDKHYSAQFMSDVEFCILNHSDKTLLNNKMATDELKLLIEADLLDEEGALGIAFDLMVAGAMKPRNYQQGYDMVLNHTGHILEQDYMITPLAKKYWNEKKDLVKKFLDAYMIDMCPDLKA